MRRPDPNQDEPSKPNPTHPEPIDGGHKHEHTEIPEPDNHEPPIQEPAEDDQPKVIKVSTRRNKKSVQQ